MTRTTIRFAVVLAVLSMTGIAVAADKYASPTTDPTAKCITTFDTGYPTSGLQKSKSGDQWLVTGAGLYNYDDAWAFTKLECKLIYRDTTSGALRSGPVESFTDETTLPTPGAWSSSFTVAPPKAGEELLMFVAVYISKDSGKSTSVSPINKKTVPVP